MWGPDVNPIPHVSGLCRAHHDDVEEHRAWIKLEEGVFVWYDSKRDEVKHRRVWTQLGPLNPQPGSREGKPKKRRKKGKERRARRVWSISVPMEEIENGAGILDDLIEGLKEKHDDDRSPYYILVDSLNYRMLNEDA